MTTEEKIRKQLAENAVLLYMKGTPDEPKCGFSRNAVEALKGLGNSYAFVNVLEAPFIREKLPSISNWPTYPQLFINGELIGGSDVIVAMVEDGSLKPMLDAVGGA
ncbi:glutaredoxin [Marinobacterium zhoushanense]|uniref:Glutaredoxin n=1 Tax=Marinobacterium zhoushanense TaxID=1679163 RepID=A0ABQ1KL52_9GAMM|nr:Grx4 family monothiol glutaredoxin [Marinobacterium zhoushanense]GGC00520.1 glutaredoxin [Marinobacterium zhoushanense]